MAAEKLTKARFVQILVIFIILAAAFTWRTFQHKPKENEVITCVVKQPCRLEIGETKVSILFSQTPENRLNISTQPIDNRNKKENIMINLNSTIISKRTVNLLNQNVLVNPVSELNNSRWAVSNQEGKILWFNLLIQNQ